MSIKLILFKMNNISLWSNNKGEYADEIILETEDKLTMIYCGQKSGRMDKCITNGSNLFIKECKKYKFIGNVSMVKALDKEENEKINKYLLVVDKKKLNLSFKTKNQACEHFGWPRLNKFEVMSGIISHKSF